MYYSNLDKLFNDLVNRNFSRQSYSNMIVKNSESETYEINYTKDGAYLLFEVPGFNKNNLKVEVENGILYIEGKRSYKLNDEEISRTISQNFKIGQEYDSESIEATIEDGILTVFVANMKKNEKKKRISLL
jgi:HSP20 family molecular chaperone IbpA